MRCIAAVMAHPSSKDNEPGHQRKAGKSKLQVLHLSFSQNAFPNLNVYDCLNDCRLIDVRQESNRLTNSTTHHHPSIDVLRCYFMETAKFWLRQKTGQVQRHKFRSPEGRPSLLVAGFEGPTQKREHRFTCCQKSN